MSKRSISLILALLAFSVNAGSAIAEQSRPGLSFELGGGIQVLPSYQGADSFVVGGFPIIKFNRLELKNGFTLGGDDNIGLGFRPSFNVRSERNPIDYPELRGLNSINTAVELGLGMDYEIDSARFFGDLRRGVTGHDGFVGEAGIQLIAKPLDGLSVSAGPQVSFADRDFMNTYFGVSATEAAASGKAAFSANGGLKSAGVSAAVRYEFNQDWGVQGAVAWDRLVGDAANSPIVKNGSADQFSMRLGLFRKFSIEF